MTSRTAPWGHIGAALAGVLYSTSVAAQPSENASRESMDEVDELSELSLEELLDMPVVTASGRAEERALAAANVFVVTREEIDSHRYHSLADILRRVPGMYLINDHVTHSIGVREVTGGYRGGTRIVKFMIDGFPVSFRPDSQAFIGPEFIPLETIERVEVAKGPLSALYGANAFLATVNVITRKPERSGAEVAGQTTVVNHNAGFGTSAAATYAGDNNSILLAVDTERVDRSGFTVERTYEFQDLRDPRLAEASENDIARPLSVFGRYDRDSNSLGHFQLNVGYQELDTGGEFQLNSVLTHRSRINLYNRFANLNWQRVIAQKLTLKSYVGVSNGASTDSYELFLTNNTSAGYRPRFGYTAFNGQLEVSYDFGPWLGVSLGADAERNEEDVLHYRQVLYRVEGERSPLDEIDLIGESDPRTQTLHQVGTYLQLNSAPVASLPDFRLTGAVRQDWMEFGSVSYPSQTSYRGAIVNRFSPELTVKLIGGRAFQAPSGTLLFAHAGFGNNKNLVGSERLDDPRPLRPQVVTSTELVASSQLGDMASLEGSVYRQVLSDAIRFNQVGAIIVAKNSGSKTTAGAELVLNLHLGWFRPYVAGSVSRQVEAEVTRDLAGITTFDGSPSLYPRWMGHAGFDIELLEALLYANTELFFVGPRGASQANFYDNDSRVYDLPSYNLLDVTLTTGDLPLLDPAHGTRLSFSARNLLNHKYYEPGFAGVDIPQSGTSLFFELRQNL